MTYRVIKGEKGRNLLATDLYYNFVLPTSLNCCFFFPRYSSVKG